MHFSSHTTTHILYIMKKILENITHFNYNNSIKKSVSRRLYVTIKAQLIPSSNFRVMLSKLPILHFTLKLLENISKC